MDSTTSARHEGMPLPQAINTATRSIHTKLNKKILALLPLALPPVCPSPTKYASGLLHIAAIYVTFETAWRDILTAVPGSPNNMVEQLGQDREAELSTRRNIMNVNERIHAILSRLHLSKLLRSESLKSDLRSVTGWDEQTVDEQLEAVGKSLPLADFLTHVRRSISLKPHVLIAYTYILYMALFAGGRFIRATLEGAGEAFWTADNDISRRVTVGSLVDLAVAEEDATAVNAPKTIPISFLRFDTPTYGEDLKGEFKQQLLDSEYELTGPERDDIVRESICIFEHMIFLVEQLDSIHSQAAEAVRRPSLFDLGQILNPLVSRMRDSLSVAKERNRRDGSADSSSTASNSNPGNPQQIRSSMGNSPSHSRQSSGKGEIEQPVTTIRLIPSPKGVRFQTSVGPADEPYEANMAAALHKSSGWPIADGSLRAYAVAGTATAVIVAIYVGSVMAS